MDAQGTGQVPSPDAARVPHDLRARAHGQRRPSPGQTCSAGRSVARGESADGRAGGAEHVITAVPPDPTITLAEYAEQWLTIVAGELEPVTWRHYRASLRLHILPVLGRTRLRELRRRHVKALRQARRRVRAKRRAPHQGRALLAADRRGSS